MWIWKSGEMCATSSLLFEIFLKVVCRLSAFEGNTTHRAYVVRIGPNVKVSFELIAWKKLRVSINISYLTDLS